MPCSVTLALSASKCLPTGPQLLKDLERWVGKICEDVVDGGFGQVVCEVLPRPLASDDRLSAIAEHGQLHSIRKI